jgi:hypothetical protein
MTGTDTLKLGLYGDLSRIVQPRPYETYVL